MTNTNKEADKQPPNLRNANGCWKCRHHFAELISRFEPDPNEDAEYTIIRCRKHSEIEVIEYEICDDFEESHD